jgi:hypothetical protein
VSATASGRGRPEARRVADGEVDAAPRAARRAASDRASAVAR